MANNNGSGSLSLQDIIEKDILDISGGANLPQEEKEKLYAKIMETIRFRAFVAIDERLDESGREDWKKHLDAGDEEKWQKFLQDKGINFPGLVVDEAIKYKIEVATYMEYFKNAQDAAKDVKEKIEQQSNAMKQEG